MLLVADFFNDTVNAFITGTVLIDMVPVVPDGGFDFPFELASEFFVFKPEFFGAVRLGEAKEFSLLT